MRFSSLVLLALLCTPWSRAGAAPFESAWSDDDIYVHPLLTDETIRLRDEYSELSTAEFFASLNVGVAVEIHADGEEVRSEAATLATLERYSGPTGKEVAAGEEPELDVDAIVRGAGDAGSVTLALVLDDAAWEKGPPISVLEAHAMLDGLILTYGDRAAVRAEAIAEREIRGSEALEPLLDFVNDLAGRTLSANGFSASATISLPIDAVEALAGEPDLLVLELLTDESEDAGYAWPVTGPGLSGYELEDLIQSTQFYGRGFSAASEAFGQNEPGASTMHNLHPGFLDWSSSSSRVGDCTWTGTGCTLGYNDPGSEHSTAVASILVGDITHNQDPTISAAGVARRERSGVARAAGVVATESGGSLSTALAVYLTYGLSVANESSSFGGDVTCQGTGSVSVNADAMFEGGVLLFKSAGNAAHTSVTDCNVGAPAAAIGVFPVSAYQVDTATGDEFIYAGNSRGGMSMAEGRSRTIVGVTTPALYDYAYPWSSTLVDGTGAPLDYGTDWTSTGAAGPETFCCTSSATPAAAGSAALFRDWFHSTWGGLIDDPGILAVNMLLMGDRTLQTGTRSVDAFDNLWGAGKLRLRAFDGVGLDNPGSWTTGNVCVPHGSTVSIPVGGPTLLADIDVMRAVTWWYDGRYHSGTPVDDLDLELKYACGSSTCLAGGSYSVYENRERVHVVPPVSGVQYSMKIHGANVTADSEGCGQNSMRVFYAWFMEDSDREANEELSGVRPE